MLSIQKGNGLQTVTLHFKTRYCLVVWILGRNVFALILKRKSLRLVGRNEAALMEIDLQFSTEICLRPIFTIIENIKQKLKVNNPNLRGSSGSPTSYQQSLFL